MRSVKLLAIGVLLLFVQVSCAQMIVERQIVTPVPAPKEVIVAPTGYTQCVVIKAEWSNGSWIPDHQVCQYNGAPQGAAWVGGYWRCTEATQEGVCTHWDWMSGRWVKTFEAY